MADKTMHVLMFGARRAGKSSVLASMIGSFQEVARDTGFLLKADANTSAFIDSKHIGLKDIFDEYWGQEQFTLDENPTLNPDTYTFTVSYRNKHRSREIATMVFHDIPGEELTSEETAERIRQSSILLVAVDTIHLMEENGKYSSVFHKPMPLKSAIENAGFTDETNKPSPKMVLFIPLKCEKYYAEGQMNEVARRVEREFRSLIEFLTKPAFQSRVTVGITPILTMGSLAFDSFGRDETGRVLRQKPAGRPQYVYYRFIGDKLFQPRYCEQPVLYILAFLVNSSKKVQERLRESPMRSAVPLALALPPIYLIAYLIGWMLLRSKRFSEAYSRITSHLKKDENGYKMLQNPLNL